MRDGTHMGVVEINGVNQSSVHQRSLGGGSFHPFEEDRGLRVSPHLFYQVKDPVELMAGQGIPGNPTPQRIQDDALGFPDHLFGQCRERSLVYILRQNLRCTHCSLLDKNSLHVSRCWLLVARCWLVVVGCLSFAPCSRQEKMDKECITRNE